MKTYKVMGLFLALGLVSTAHAEGTKKLTCKISWSTMDSFATQDMGAVQPKVIATKVEELTSVFKADDNNQSSDSAKLEKDLTLEGKSIGFLAQSIFLKDATQGSIAVSLKDNGTGYYSQSYAKVPADTSKGKTELVFGMPMTGKGSDRILQVNTSCEVKPAE